VYDNGKKIDFKENIFEVAEKTVLETYVRETTELLHLTIGGEVIKTTFEHPFYVKDVSFVEAGKLQVGDKLLDSRGNVLVVKKLEIADKPVKVYNFKVDDFHTYHVGDNEVLVHNANYVSMQGKHIIKVEGLQGDTYYDFIKANQAAGYKSTPKGLASCRRWNYYDACTI